MNAAMTDPSADAARAELEKRIAAERCRYWTPNGRIEEFLLGIGSRFNVETIKEGRITICILRAGNGIGKTVLDVNLASYLADRYPNKYLDAVPYLREMPRPSRGRILTTANAAKNNLDSEFQKWLRKDQFEATQEGRPFKSRYKFKNGSEFDIFTFDQDPSQGESITLNWAIVDEPMSHAHWTALKSRFRFGGVIFLLLTPLRGASWYHDEFETQERLADDVFRMTGSSEANCREHGVRGLMPHKALVDMWRDFDEAELPARRDGEYLSFAGTIYKTYREGYLDKAGKIIGHEPEILPPYHAECWRRGLYTLYQVIDPHDRRPWAVTWWAVFPNGQKFCVAEWPDMTMRPFHKITSWHWGYDAYAKLTAETEKSLGFKKPAWATIMDPYYGPQATMSAGGVSCHASDFETAYRKLTGKPRRMILPPGRVEEGHILVKAALGDPANGVTPMMFFMAHCRNSKWSMTHYGYKENRDERKGLSEVPELIFKDFAEGPRYLEQARARYIQDFENAEEMVFYSPAVRGNGYRGA